MSGTAGDLTGLTPQQKRALLVELLQRNGGRLDWLVDDIAVAVRDLRARVELDSAIRGDGLPPAAPGAPPLLTGATGFLGAFLLDALLARTATDVHCLVRAPDAETGRRRLAAVLEGYGLGEAARSPRVRVVPGDLSRPLLGLAPAAFEALAGRAGAIYHSGALTSWVHPYAGLEAANVGGTREVLRLATTGTLKPVHHVSTLAVFPLLGRDAEAVIGEDDSLDHDGVLHGGYAQSKWVAEQLVALAGARGVPVAIYRPALVAGHSQTGAWNAADAMSQMVRTWAALGAAHDLTTPINMVPVDHVSRAIVFLSQSAAAGQRFHLASPRHVGVGDLVEWTRRFGYRLERIPYEAWRARLSARGQAAAVLPLFALTVAGAAPALLRAMPRFDCRRTLEALAGSGLACPLPDAALFHRSLAFLVGRGALPPPERQAVAP